MRVYFSVLFLAVAAVAQQPVRPSVPSSGANLPTQPVGPSDLISLSVYEAPELTVTIRIGPDGYIRVPMLKQRVKVDGLTPAEIETAIATALKQEQLFVDPIVTVGIAEYHSRPISVNGAVKMPLVFQAEGPTTLLEALARAQGLREDAGPEILVTHAQPGPDGKAVSLTRRILVRGLIDAADPALNLTLDGGEEVRVPEASRIYVVGNVKKPGAFPVKEGSDTTVFQMLALSEGLTPYASKQAYIYRREASGTKNEIVVPLDKIMERKAPDVPLVANDILYIPDNKTKRMTLGALEKVLGVGTALGAATIYVMH